MVVLWGFIIFNICHTIANIFGTNIYCYIKERECKKPNSYAIKQYLMKITICLAVYITVFIIAMLVKPFADNKAVTLICNSIGFISGGLHFYLMAEENYKMLKAKHEWNSWNYMSFEEKRETIRSQQNISEKDQPSTLSSKKLSPAPSPSTHDENKIPSNKKMTHAEHIINFYKNKELKAKREPLPNGDEIITVNYQIKYIWDLYIKIDNANGLIKMYTLFFYVKPSKKGEIYEVLNEWNQKYFYIKFSYENTPWGPFVVAANDIPLIDSDYVGKYVFDIADEFIRTIDNHFELVPIDLVEY